MRLLAGLMLSAMLLAAAPTGAQTPQPSASAPAADTRLPAGIPLRRGPEATAEVGPSGYAAWLVVLVLALGGLWLVRRARGATAGWPLLAKGSAPQPAPRILASRTIGPHLSVQVIEWNGKETLLGCTQHSVTVIDWRPVQDADSPGASAARPVPSRRGEES